MAVYIYSTQTNSTAYPEWRYDPGKPFHTMKRKVIINGGTGVANKHFVTPMGVMTKVSDEDFAFLKENAMFQRAVKNGWHTYDTSRQEPEDMAKNMKIGDGSAPKNPVTIKETPGGAPIIENKGKGDKSFMEKVGDRFKRE